MNRACKSLNEPLTTEEQWVLKVLKNKPIMLLPKDYYVSIIEAIYVATVGDRETMAYLVKLADIHPAICNAVQCLVNGNLEARYDHQRRQNAEVLCTTPHA